MRSRRLGEIRRKSLNRSEHGGTSLPFSGRRLHSVGGTSGLVWPSQFTHAHFKLRVQRHRIVTATLALQPSFRARYHWAESVRKFAVSATENWLCVHWHQVEHPVRFFLTDARLRPIISGTFVLPGYHHR